MGFKSYAQIADVQELPRLIEVQLSSFQWIIEHGLRELFDEITPIASFNKNLELHFPGIRNKELCEEFDLRFWFEEPKYSEAECVERDMTFAAPLYVKTLLYNREQDQPIVREIFFGDFPLMTENGTFIINGTERVVVSQLIRSPGVYFAVEEDRATGRLLSEAKLIPDRGAWMEFESRKSDYIAIKFNRKRTIPVTIFLRALAALTIEDFEAYFSDAATLAMFRADAEGSGFFSILNKGTDEELIELFAGSDTHPDHPYILSTIKQEPVWGGSAQARGATNIAEEAALEFYKRMRPGDPLTMGNAKEFLISQIFDPWRYDLERVGRYKLNQRLGLAVPSSVRIVTKRDLVALVDHMIRLNNGLEDPDDIDHLGNRRVKTVGELIQQKLRVGLRRMERVVRERMSIRESENITPIDLINIRPVVATVREFFGSSQLSQFMDQTNPLSELTHKRTLSALGPGGLRRERAGFDVRDVHHSHYGRICPIETPEGPNIGLIGRLANYARVNSYGFIETPYRRVVRSVPPTVDALVGHTLRKAVVDPHGTLIAEAGTDIDLTLARRIAAAFTQPDAALPDETSGPEETSGGEGSQPDQLPPVQPAHLIRPQSMPTLSAYIDVVPTVTDQVEYLSADVEDRYRIAQANAPLDEKRRFVNQRISVRHSQQFLFEVPDRVDYMDVSPKQIVGISAALIPFLEHDDANRALMGSNMQRQAVPLLAPDSPVVGTGMETRAAIDSGHVIVSNVDGQVVAAQGDKVVVANQDGQHLYPLRKFRRSNQSTNIDQRPVVHKGDLVRKGQVLADSASTQRGRLALGQDVLCAFISWEGANYEDAIIISEQLVRDDKFTSIHIEKHETRARETKLGPEEITHDIPNVGEDALRDLDEFGVIRIGAEVGPNEILVGKITPKGEKELTPEEKLLRAIFGDKAREVRDSSLRLPHGEHGRVVDVRFFDREEHRDLPAGVNQLVRVGVAQKRKLTEGDKMAGRHGNKGVISSVVPIQDMPFLEDGTPIQIILNPLGVPGRMNIGQILETHLGSAASRLGFNAITPVFDGAGEQQIKAELARAWLVDQAWLDLSQRTWSWLSERQDVAEHAPDQPAGPAPDPGPPDVGPLPWRRPAPGSHYQDDLEARLAYILHSLGGPSALQARGYDPERLVNDMLKGDHHYARYLVAREWLADKGHDPDALLAPYFDQSSGLDADGPTSVWASDDVGPASAWASAPDSSGRALRAEPQGEASGRGPSPALPGLRRANAVSRAHPSAHALDPARAIHVGLALWIQHTLPDAASEPGAAPQRRGASGGDPSALADKTGPELEALANQVFLQTGHAPPTSGKVTLYDGKTGQPFDQPVTVGVIHMMKLAHLVEDKVHARSTGPYSLVTQQPLGGKAQFGGQRFGEMEVWALEAYGAAHTLQEILTVKSDDMVGRVKTYEAIVKGEAVHEAGVPASFQVLVKELQSLGLAVEAIGEGGEVYHFGKEDRRERVPRLRTGLNLLGGPGGLGSGLESWSDDLA